MTEMANPIKILMGLEEQLGKGMPAEPCEVGTNYKKFFEEYPDGKSRRYIFAKVDKNEVQAISIFGREDSFGGIERYSVGYAVRENCRGRKLSIEAVQAGIQEMRRVMKAEGIEKFYLEAIIDEKNIASINIAEKLFKKTPFKKTDSESGTPSKVFYELINT